MRTPTLVARVVQEQQEQMRAPSAALRDWAASSVESVSVSVSVQGFSYGSGVAVVLRLWVDLDESLAFGWPQACSPAMCLQQLIRILAILKTDSTFLLNNMLRE